MGQFFKSHLLLKAFQPILFTPRKKPYWTFDHINLLPQKFCLKLILPIPPAPKSIRVCVYQEVGGTFGVKAGRHVPTRRRTSWWCLERLITGYINFGRKFCRFHLLLRAFPHHHTEFLTNPAPPCRKFRLLPDKFRPIPHHLKKNPHHYYHLP